MDVRKGRKEGKSGGGLWGRRAVPGAVDPVRERGAGNPVGKTGEHGLSGLGTWGEAEVGNWSRLGTQGRCWIPSGRGWEPFGRG